MDYRLKTILEGLLVIAVESEAQEALLNSLDISPDEYFDFEVLDYLPYQVEIGAIPEQAAIEIENLYKEGEKVLRGFNWVQEDDFFSSNANSVKEWRKRAKLLLNTIELHNKALVWDGFAALRHHTA